MAGTDNESDDASVHNETTNTKQQPNIQPQIITTVLNKNAMFPYLKNDEYEVWAIKMEYWITNNDMNIWKVIQNGNNLKRTGRDRDGGVIILPPTTAEEHITVQRESKARTTLLQSIPDDHVADFHYMDDTRDIWNVIKARFGGNAESKKIRKSMLKQEFSEFRIGEAERLHKGYDRMQKIMSQLNQLKAKPKNEDINLKFLRALPSSWSQVALTLKTKDGLGFLSFDDLYYKLKTLEVDVKGHTTFSSSQSAGPSHSVFVSATSATKKMSYEESPSYSSNTTYSASSNLRLEQQLAYEDFEQIEKLDLEEMDLKWQMAMLSVRVHKFEQKTGRNIDFDKKESARFNKKKVRCYKCQQRGHFARECRAKGGNKKKRYSSFKIKEIGKKEEDSKAMITVDTLVDWTDHDDESVEVITAKEFGMIAGCDSEDAIKEGAAKIYNLITKANSEEANTAGDAGEFAFMGVTSEVHNCPFGYDNKYNELKKQYNELNEQNSESFIQVQAYKNSLKTLEKQKRVLQRNQLTVEDKIRVLSIELENTSNLLKHSERINADFETAKKDLQTKLDNHLDGMTLHLVYLPLTLKMWKVDLFSIVTSLQRPTQMTLPPVILVSNLQSTSRIILPLVHQLPVTDKVNIPPVRPQPVLTGKPKVSTPVPTGRPNRPSLFPTDREFSPSVVLGNDIEKVITGYPRTMVDLIHLHGQNFHIHKEHPFSAAEDEGIFDSGCSRSMNGNKEILDDFQAFQGGKVTFGGGEGRITGKGTIRTPTLDFKNVYYVKELQQFNLFSISQICDKKNQVLFTDTECLVLSKDFKLPDDSMVVLRVLKKHNLYTINLNNLCPRGNLACLLAHALFDESVKWHRRMGHVNYKNLNRLVKGNLVRGLPSKLFKNDQACVACCKGKQHKASYKAIHAVSSISEPLQPFHMDLFGPTSIRSIDHKYYCLVITNDYSRFCWIVFLEHKDETYPILKDFINLVENQLKKGIKREYSNPKTLQQNRVAERKNKTLIEAARTMLADSKLPTMFWTEVVRTACYVLNRVSVTSPHNKTPYALLTGNIPSVSHFKPFGCHVTIQNISDHLGKFDGKADEGYIVGYSASTQGATTNSVGIQAADSDSDCDEQIIIVPSYPPHSIQRSEPKDNSGDKVNDSPFQSADEIFQKELQRLKDQEQRVTSDAESLGLGFSNNAEALQTQTRAKTVPPGCIPVPLGKVPVPTGSLPVPTGSIQILAAATKVSTDDVIVYTSSSTDLIFYDEPTTRFSYPSDLGNHDLLPSIFSSSSYDDEFGAALNNVASTVEVSPVATTRIHTIHPQSMIIGDLTSAVQTRSKVKQTTTGDSTFISCIFDQQRDNYTDYQHCLFACFLSQVEPRSVAQVLKDPSWVDAVQEEMQQGIVVRNKDRLVVQGHRQEEGIDYDEVFAPIAKIEAIRLFLAFASYMGFLVYQMDVKSAFLYERIDEEVYVTQPKGFVDPQHPKKVYKVVKPLYELHQGPRAWYATLSTFLLKHGYRRGTIDKTLFLKKNNKDIILVQVYVDDIIFGSTKKAWCDEFEALMKGEFEMSAMGELTFFLGLQIQQRPDGIFINQDKYVQEILTKFDLGSVKMTTTPYEAPKPKSKNESDSPVNCLFTASSHPYYFQFGSSEEDFQYLKGQPKLGLWYPKESPLVLEAYSDSDYAGANKDRKSTTGECQFLGRRLISWQCKKQTIVATSSIEAEYVAAANCCGQPNGLRRWISAFQVLYMDQVALFL
nr:putative ribonuclease H-like domain-containing protein [Tanacetum cinerariifolium]